MLKDNNMELSKYAGDAASKKYEFWQRDPLAIYLYSSEVMQRNQTV